MALDRIKWTGQGIYRVLSYYFAVRWNDPDAERFLDRSLAPFAVAEDPDEYPEPRAPGIPAHYSIVRRRSEALPYRLLYGEGEINRFYDLHSALGSLIIHINHMAIRRSCDYLLVHAGAVSTPSGEGVLLPASSGSGKTTMVTGLIRAGYGYLSDEGGAIDPVTRMVFPFRKALWLKQGHVSLFPELCPNGDGTAWLSGLWPVPAEEIRADSVSGPCAIRFIIGLTYRPGAPTEVKRLTPAEGAVLIAGNSFNLAVYRSRAVRLAVDVAKEAQSYGLISGDFEGGLRAIMEITEGRRRTTP